MGVGGGTRNVQRAPIYIYIYIFDYLEISCERQIRQKAHYNHSEQLCHSSTTAAEGVVHGIDWPEWLPVSN